MKKVVVAMGCWMVLLTGLWSGAVAGDYKLPDTGQTKCYNNIAEITCPQPGTPFCGQDGCYTINLPSYTKLDAQGNDLPDSATSWVMVRDNVTGLVWEVKTDDQSIHYMYNRYAWQNAQDEFIAELNSQQFGGYFDWRMPTIKELTTIIDHGKHDPAINTDYFPNTRSPQYWRPGYWSSTTFANKSDGAWGVSFYSAIVSVYLKSDYSDPGNFVRAVRGGSGAAQNSFMDNEDGTVTDTTTGLMWQKETAESKMQWEDALSYCENLTLAGYNDWRLPNERELGSLVDYDKYGPSIDTVAFPDTVSFYYWSSTTYSLDRRQACDMSFESGHSQRFDKYHNYGAPYHVRAVRGGQASSFNNLTFPLSGTLADRTVNLSFGADWPDGECDGLIKKHAGVDISAVKGESVYAANPGIVRAIVDGGTQWKKAVTIEHTSSNPVFTTVYWHIDPAVAVGQTVISGQIIGNIADLGNNTHLHFGVRMSAYSNISNRGALPQTDCEGDPAFPEHFVDPLGLGYAYVRTSFSFPNIDAPQYVDTPFPVTITAMDSNSNRVWGFNGSVSLTSSLGSVSPTSVNIVDGQATVSVRLYNPGNTRLNCSGSGKYGNSNYFDVTGATACTGKIFGKVIDAKGDVVYQADVKLHEPGGLVVAEDLTDANGEFSFTGIACGTYEVSVIKDGHSKTVSNVSVSSTLPQILDDIRLQINSGTRVTPVILVPGMMGSTYDSTQVFPVLTAIPGLHYLSIWDYEGRAGWENLELYLHDMDFKVFKCPWDWRMTCEEAYKEYLIEKIDEALNYSTTGKVDIIAHSMGGLVVRAYIQSSDYRGDIDKLAMVGTPHLGSCNPYYIWEGGDPKTFDDITTKFWDLDYEAALTNAYSRTINELLGTYGSFYYSPVDYSSKINFGLPLFPFCMMPHENMRDFVRWRVPSLGQLMYTEDFLKDKSGLRAVTTDGNENKWLKGLNQGNSDYVKPSDRMSAKNDGKVQVKLFVGTKAPENYSTIAYVTTLDQDNPDYKNDLYEDGIPKQPMETSVTMWDGDGTVPYDSATWPLIDGWADIETPTLVGNHISLVKTYRDQITAFLTGEVSASRAIEKSSKAKDAQVTPSSELSFSVTGTVRLMITNPEGQQTGIEPDTYNPVEQIPLSKSVFSSAGGGVSVENPAQGAYAVTFFGEAARDFRLNIGFSDGEITEIKQFRGFCPAAARTFTVLVAPSDTPRITVTLQAKAPTGLKAEPYASGGPEQTRLTWSTTGEADITGYNVYSVAEQEPYFSKVATLAAGTTSYDSTDQWSSDASTKVMTYAVTAVKSDGAESFFSVLAQNNDRDHDWITDEKEASLGTDPNKADTDSDGLNDGEELSYYTNPLVKDTDGDGYNDNVEIKRGSDPLDPSSVPVIAMPWLQLLLWRN